MRRVLRTVLLAVLAGVFAVSAFMLIRQSIQYKEGEATYDEAAELAGVPDLSALAPAEPESSASAAASSAAASSAVASASAPAAVYADPYADALRSMDFSALQAVNPDVLGWIVIPGTPISYPVVQGDDNQYYLKHTWRRQVSAVGAIFLECNSSRDLSDFNTIVYGHRMNNGSMFASLKYYKKQSYYKQHPMIYLTDQNGAHAYQIFAAYEVSTEGCTYQLGFSGDTAKQAFLDECGKLSVISTGVTPTVNDRILTLSTCTGNGHATRWVVQARLKGSEPAQKAGTPAAQTAPETVPAASSSAAPAASQEPAASQSASSQTPAGSAAETQTGAGTPQENSGASQTDSAAQAAAPPAA
jgi:sortase B